MNIVIYIIWFILIAFGFLWVKWEAERERDQMSGKQGLLDECDKYIENCLFKIIKYRKQMLDPEFDAENIKNIMIPLFEKRIKIYKKLKTIIENFWDKEVA